MLRSLLAIAVVPAWVALLARHFGVSGELPVLAVAALVAIVAGYLAASALVSIPHLHWRQRALSSAA